MLIGREKEKQVLQSALSEEYSQFTHTGRLQQGEHLDLKLAKVFIDHTLESVSASCEFFYTDMESLKNNVEHVLGILGMVRSTYYMAKAEFTD